MSSEGTFMRPYVAPPRVLPPSPDGKRFQAWRDGFGARQHARFGLDETSALKMVTVEHRRIMRNARKAERRPRGKR